MASQLRVMNLLLHGPTKAKATAGTAAAAAAAV